MTARPINYSTVIDPMKTVTECTELLARHGARKILTEYGPDRQPTGLSFQVDAPWGPQQFRMEVNPEGTYRVLAMARKRGEIAPRFATREQAARVAWRVLKTWVEVCLALSETGIVNLTQAMLSFAMTGPDTTQWDDFATARAITAGGGDDQA